MNTNVFTRDLDYELFKYFRNYSEVNFVDNQLKQSKTTEYEGKTLRLIKDKKLALVSGTENIPDGVLLKKGNDALPFASSANFSFKGFEKFSQDSSSLVNESDFIQTEKSIEHGKALLDRLSNLKEFSDFSYSMTLWSAKEAIRIGNSSFNEKEFDRSHSGFYLLTKRVMPDDILILYFVSHKFIDVSEIDSWLSEIDFNRTLELSKNIVTLDTGKYPTIFHPDALMSMLISLVKGLSMKSVYEKISPIKDKLNQPIFDERITIIDDPTYAKGTKRALFDDEGVPCSKKKIVEDGVLKYFLTDLEYATKCGVEPTGNGFKESIINDSKLMGAQPSIWATNLDLHALNDGPSVEDMIKDIKNGIFIHDCPDSWMGNIVSGDMSGNITQGYKIENGKLTGRVKNKRYSGNIYNLLGSQLVTISNEAKMAANGADKLPYIMSNDVSIT